MDGIGVRLHPNRGHESQDYQDHQTPHPLVDIKTPFQSNTNEDVCQMDAGVRNNLLISSAIPKKERQDRGKYAIQFA